MDSLSFRVGIANQLKTWKIKDEIATNAEAAIFIQIKQLIEHLYPSGLEAKPQHPSSVTTQIGSRSYSLVKKDKNNLIYKVKDSTSTFKYEGELSVNRKTLFVSEYTLYQDYTEHKFQSITHVKTVKSPSPQSKISPEYGDMLVLQSFLSEALYTNNEPDSSKVMNFINQYSNSPYKDDQAFVQNKLGLLQRINNRTGYYEALNNSPIELLKGTHHLSNILYRDDNISIEKFGQIVPLMDNARLYDWFQNSFYQDLNRDGNSYEEKLNLLVNNMTEEVGKSAYPMALWYKAKRVGNNIERKKALVHELLALDNDSWTEGNAGRYALFLYKDMNAVDSIYSTQLLHDIITRLTTVYEQSSGAEQKINKSHLATAHYFTYLATKNFNPNHALVHLEKASEYSPSNERELEYSSNYDIMFLNGKKSYTEDYLTVLSTNGDKDIALQKYIADFLSAQASSYAGLRTFYEENYPNGSFSKFFLKDVLPQTADAPAFVLNDIQNEAKTLENIKGKWTLVDFWGTWCGPCVAEMPKLNAFHEELKKDDSKSQKINFLTIACHDTEEKVKNFLAKNDYNIPVLMSDGEVQKLYNVDGYPSKYIISPEGKLIAIPLGFNWQPLLESLASL